MTEIRHLKMMMMIMMMMMILKIDMTSFFSAEGGPIWRIKFRWLVQMQNDMSTAVIWSKSKQDVEFQYGGRLGELYGMLSQSHLAASLQGAVTWRIQCRDPRANCHIAGCCHLVNSLSWFQSHMPHCRVREWVSSFLTAHQHKKAI